MPEKSRGAGKAAQDDDLKKNVSFEADLISLDDKFEELKKPVYKGKRLDDPISSVVVRSSRFVRGLMTRINGNCCPPFSKSKGLLSSTLILSIIL